MTDTDLDSGQEAGTAGNTNQTGSEQKGDKQSSFDAKSLQSTLESLVKRLDEVDARSKSLQGDKDRGVKKTNDEVEKLKNKIAELERYRKAGYDDDTAFEEMTFREEVRSLREQIATINKASAGNGGVDTAQVVSDAGLDPADPDVIAEITAKRWDNPDAAELAAFRLAKRKGKAIQPSEADKATPPSKPVQQGKLTEDDYKKDMLSAPRGAKGAEQRAAIKQKYLEAGVNVHAVDFTP